MGKTKRNIMRSKGLKDIEQLYSIICTNAGLNELEMVKDEEM